ncbi:pyridoxal kinase PdxY [Photobacterium leiognathi]|uniref:Pyridoxal kinase PdxY n=1 Tax=Photobacterium leiognathi TaxID=553611 RepID=A0A2T3MDP0_PHOLE|nr:pyridoxal kinase PdxY [Photobacterium leiognathi]KJF89955.1 pyridoxamine kinase [Photobacterium leiognathi]KJF97924.1 pyridoxamine kinase [Photobacterium leiognathi]PSV83560.1 pyridoxal kinase PdxY [Photobacterium leiognathi]PSV91773.1 pyridoxal kinase PdxY [Photobacterium leiognathi]PSW46439.1 pyridoxal kinase PdxY [Photobacterium leiognathi subsp. mandapamensis]
MKGILSIQSHVVYGHAGNSSAVFPMQRMGFEVWPLHTVQFSNHTQYKEGWTGKAFSGDDISELVAGIEGIDQLKNCEAVLTGYQGSASQCLAIIDTVKKVKQHNPNAIYICDPVMGDPEKGCIVADGIAEYLINDVMPIADAIVPNQFELSQFVGMEIHNLNDAVAACKKALTMGPKMVLVKHLHSISDEKFTMMLATAEGCFLAQRPHLKFDKQPVGVGDLISSLFTAGLLKGWAPEQAFEHAHNACYAVLKETSRRGEWELQTIAAQDEIVAPSEVFPISAITE